MLKIDLKRPRCASFVLALVSLIFAVPLSAQVTIPDAPEDAGATTFVQKCISCHAGVLTNMDLLNTANRSTETLDAAVRRMEINTGPLTEKQVSDLVELMKDTEFKFRVAEAKLDRDEAFAAASAASVPAQTNNGTSTAANWMVSGTTATAASDAGTSAGTGEVASETDDAAILYSQSCAGCHTLGSGAPLSGPDLVHVATWADPDLSAAVKRMESKVGPLTDPQVSSLVTLLKDPAVKDRLHAAEQKKMQTQTASMDKPSTDTGDLLYHGGLAFSNGGIACAACHAIGGEGGNMGPDLTDVYARMGDNALQSAITQANFKVMKAAYRDHQVTPQEAVHLSAYLAAAGSDTPADSSSNSGVHLFSLAGTALLLGALGLMQRNRKSRNIRSKLVRRR